MSTATAKFEQALKPLLVNKTQAAALLGITERTLEAMIRRREILAIRIGRQVLVPYVDVAAYAGF